LEFRRVLFRSGRTLGDIRHRRGIRALERYLLYSEKGYIIATAGHVARDCFEHIRQQGARKHGLIDFQWVLYGYHIAAFVIGVEFPGIEDLSVDKRTRDNFRIPRVRQRVTNGAAALLRGAQATAANGRNWQNGRNGIQAFQARSEERRVGKGW